MTQDFDHECNKCNVTEFRCHKFTIKLINHHHHQSNQGSKIQVFVAR